MWFPDHHCHVVMGLPIKKIEYPQIKAQRKFFSFLRKEKNVTVASVPSVIEKLDQVLEIPFGTKGVYSWDICRKISETLKNDRVIGSINLDVFVYAFMYSGRSLPLPSQLKTEMDSSGNLFCRSSFGEIKDYLYDLLGSGFQHEIGLYSIFSNESGLENHRLKIDSFDDNPQYTINSFMMDFLYHGPTWRGIKESLEGGLK